MSSDYKKIPDNERKKRPYKKYKFLRSLGEHPSWMGDPFVDYLKQKSGLFESDETDWELQSPEEGKEKKNRARLASLTSFEIEKSTNL